MEAKHGYIPKNYPKLLFNPIKLVTWKMYSPSAPNDFPGTQLSIYADSVGANGTKGSVDVLIYGQY